MYGNHVKFFIRTPNTNVCAVHPTKKHEKWNESSDSVQSSKSEPFYFVLFFYRIYTTSDTHIKHVIHIILLLRICQTKKKIATVLLDILYLTVTTEIDSVL